MIIETSANQLYRVTETGDADLAHVWSGIEVKRVRGEFVPKKNARPALVRKAASRVVEA
jgi:hypothetical protein